MLAQAFAGKMAVLLDAACLVGTGVSPMPAGLAAISGVNQESMGTNGLALTSFSELLDLRLALDAANAAAPTAWIMAPRTAATIAAFADSNGQWLNPPAWLNNSGTFGDGGKPPLWLTSTSVPVNQVQGSASNASSIYTGDFTQMLVGVRETLRLEVLPQLYANEGKIALVAHMRADVALTRAADFGRLVGIIP
jgi:HK97 family phage major capsid protein